MMAAELAKAIRTLGPSDVEFEGIGSERMRAAGVRLTQETTGWASLGPIEALARIPVLLPIMLAHVARLCLRPPDLAVMIDFGAVNLRFARFLRYVGFRRPILYFFPPGAWFDREEQARYVASVGTALTPFEHQRDFYTGLGLPVRYFGHPLGSLVAAREPLSAAPADGGTVAVLPGSRRGEIERHMGVALGACAALRLRRPRLRVVVSAAHDDAERGIAQALERYRLHDVEIVRGARAALDGAHAALVASGTAVLESALREVPTVAFYIVSRAQVKIARRIWKRPYITLPNILLGREIVPELLQDAAQPDALAAALEPLLADPGPQLAALREVRAALGPGDALERAAHLALELARASGEATPA